MTLEGVQRARCACGGILTASPATHGIAAAVERHRTTRCHTEWLAMGGLEYDPELAGHYPQAVLDGAPRRVAGRGAIRFWWKPQ